MYFIIIRSIDRFAFKAASSLPWMLACFTFLPVQGRASTLRLIVDPRRVHMCIYPGSTRPAATSEGILVSDPPTNSYSLDPPFLLARMGSCVYRACIATDVDAIVYLMLANDMLHTLFPGQVVTIPSRRT